MLSTLLTTQYLLRDYSLLGVIGTALQWFSSYIHKRTQYVSVNNSQSDKTYLSYGVPQGSVGGPLMFSVYLEPISTIIRKHNIKYHCYADDIQLFISVHPSSDPIADARRTLEACIHDMKGWMDFNGLKINENKPEFIILGSKNSLLRANHTHLSLHVGGEVLKPASKVRNLGVIFDNNMSFI